LCKEFSCQLKKAGDSPDKNQTRKSYMEPKDSAIPAGAPSAGVLSTFCPLIGASDVKGEGFLDDSGMEFAKDYAMVSPSTNSDLAGCNPDKNQTRKSCMEPKDFG